MQKSILKKFIPSIFAILLALCVAGFFIPLRGDWVDRIVSGILSRRLEMRVHCVNARLVRWSEVSFDKMTAGFEPASLFLESGPGEIYFRTTPFLIFHLNDIRYVQKIGASGFLSSLPISKSLQGEFLIRRLTGGWSGRRAKGFLHFFECSSDDFELKGGIQWDGRRIIKAHFYLSLSPERSKKIPKEILHRMIPREKGWEAVQIVYSQNEITLTGLQGPLFQAKWAGLA